MIYLHRYSTSDNGQLISEIAVVEDAPRAARYEAQGYDRCSREALSVAWSLRDERTLDQLTRRARVAAIEAKIRAALTERAVGHTL